MYIFIKCDYCEVNNTYKQLNLNNYLNYISNL